MQLLIIISVLTSLVIFSHYFENTSYPFHSPDIFNFVVISLLVLFIFFGYLLYSTIQNSIILLKYKLETNIQVKNEQLKEKIKVPRTISIYD